VDDPAGGVPVNPSKWCQSKANMQLFISHYDNFERISYPFRDIDV